MTKTTKLGPGVTADVDQLIEASKAQQHKMPCRRFPEYGEFKLIGLRCPICDTWCCYRRYVSWEKALGITLNQGDHPVEVDEDHKRHLERK